MNESLNSFDAMADNLTKEVNTGVVTVIVKLFDNPKFPTIHGQWWCVVEFAPCIWSLGETPEEAIANFEKENIPSLHGLFPNVTVKYEIIR